MIYDENRITDLIDGGMKKTRLEGYDQRIS